MIGFDPCGVAFGVIQRCFDQRCRFYPDDPRGPLVIRWYFADENAPQWEHGGPFFPDYYRDHWDNPGPTVCGPTTSWQTGSRDRTRTGVLSFVVDGTVEDFRGEGTAAAVLNADGTLNPHAVPSCARPPALAIGASDRVIVAGLQLGALDVSAAVAGLQLGAFSRYPGLFPSIAGLAVGAKDNSSLAAESVRLASRCSGVVVVGLGVGPQLRPALRVTARVSVGDLTAESVRLALRCSGVVVIGLGVGPELRPAVRVTGRTLFGAVTRAVARPALRLISSTQYTAKLEPFVQLALRVNASVTITQVGSASGSAHLAPAPVKPAHWGPRELVPASILLRVGGRTEVLHFVRDPHRGALHVGPVSRRPDGTPAYWVARKTAPDVWSLEQRSGERILVAYTGRSADDVHAFPLDMVREGGETPESYPGVVRLEDAP